ncbi:hypothetical protein ASZ90_000344 [hydrocarbon metagenome]|uniref:Methyltransferase type 11 domain-containing protein n=1 Tax=hydrocarbon metagenome TaxID=938273 RepID=A0A0W8G9P1_9ZZZZ
MKRRFSKSSQVMRQRQRDFLGRNADLCARSLRAAAMLSAAPARAACPLCGTASPGRADFSHRGAPYCTCRACGHIASVGDPARLPQDPDRYANVYPRLEPEELAIRVRDIYLPKLDWVLDVCESELGIPPSRLLARPWLEIGSGEGLFLKALELRGATRFTGLGVDGAMLARSRELLGEERVKTLTGPLGEAVAASGAGVVAAWFVFEHLCDLDDLARALSGLPAGTILCFAVPVYSLSVLLEAACEAHYPRTLDGEVHTQLFTDASIAYFLSRCGCTMAGEWVFGQDASDLGRLLEVVTDARGGPAAARGLLDAFGRAVEDLQAVIDRHMLADSRHIVAVRA